MFDAAKTAGLLERQDWWDVVDALGISSTGARVEMAMATSSELVDRGVPQQSIQLLPFVPCEFCLCTGDLYMELQSKSEIPFADKTP